LIPFATRLETVPESLEALYNTEELATRDEKPGEGILVRMKKESSIMSRDFTEEKEKLKGYSQGSP